MDIIFILCNNIIFEKLTDKVSEFYKECHAVDSNSCHPVMNVTFLKAYFSENI